MTTDGCFNCQIVSPFICSGQPSVCVQSICGDSILKTSQGEQCDDGGATSGDGCSSTCQLEAGFTCNLNVSPTVCIRNPVCGNGAI